MPDETMMHAALAALPWALSIALALALGLRRRAPSGAAGGSSPPDAPSALVEGAVLRAMEEELATLRAAAGACPWPAWHTAADGTLTWVNAAYLALEDAVEGGRGAHAWPPRALFPDGEGRAAIRFADGGGRVFERSAVRTEGGAMNFAAPADAAHAAERRLSQAMLAFTGVFSRIETGLALFDAQDRLRSFNPALVDLTGLPAPFLASRPTLGAVMDRLRGAGLAPETGGAWHARVRALRDAAAQGTLRESWTLPTGGVWRVSGQRAAEGAVALLIEDATPEARFGLRLRGAMALSQSLVEAMEGAVCVFDASGALAASNAAYAALWEVDSRRLTGDATLADALRRWRGRALPGGAWDALEAAASPGGGSYEGDALLRDGRHLSCAAIPLGGGAVLMRFEETGRRTPLSVVGAEPVHA